MSRHVTSALKSRVAKWLENHHVHRNRLRRTRRRRTRARRRVKTKKKKLPAECEILGG